MDSRIQLYMERMDEIRKLSSPGIAGIDSADVYEKKLLSNFKRIGELGLENRRLIKELIDPIISSEGKLSEEERSIIKDIETNLFDSKYASALDMPMVRLLHERACADDSGKDDEAIIDELDMTISVFYIFLAHYCRIITALDKAKEMSDSGLVAYKKLRTYLDHDKFLALPDRSKKLLLNNIPYCALFYNAELYKDQEDRWRIHEKKCEELLEAEKLAYDDFYTKAYPDFNWELYKYGICYYFSFMNEEDVPPKYQGLVIEKIREGIKRTEEASEKNRGYCEALYPLENFYASLYGKQYIAGEISYSDFKNKLLELCRRAEDDNREETEKTGSNLDLSQHTDIYNILFGNMIESGKMTEEDTELISDFYKACVADAFHMQIDDDFHNLVSSYFTLMLTFTEIPGGMGYEELGMKLFAAIHPPTYIHSTMVAKISHCLAKHLIPMKPELFVGVCGCRDAEEVLAKKHLILDYTHHAALCHDFGKLGIMDTIYIYGRALLDQEFGILKEHPMLGAELLKKHSSTRVYADVAAGHHRWYDDSRGYPEEFKTADRPVKTIIDIVTCADCMDAATDSVGRSYSTGKTFEQYEAEVAEGAGTRYAPYFPELFKKPEVREDLLWLLSEGRHRAYRNTYYLLKDMKE